MAFPTIPTVAAGRVLTTNQADTSGTRTFPSLSSLTKNSGDLLIAIVVGYQSAGTSGAVFSSWGASFTERADLMTTSGSTMCVGIATKVSTGSETGTFTVTQASPTGHASLILLSIPGAHRATAIEAGTIANGTSAAADPASFNPAGWDVEDTLWIALAASGMTSGTGSWTGTGTSAPANFTDRVDSNTSDNSTVGQVEAAVAFRQQAAASQDVGTAGVDTSNARNSAVCIAVRPANDQTVTAGVASLATAVFAPTVSSPLLVTPPKLSVSTATFAPTIQIATVVTPATAGVTTTTFAPTVSATTSVVVTPGTASISTATFAPTVTTPVLVTVGRPSLTLAPFAPTVTASENQTVVPDVRTVTVTRYAPSVATGGPQTVTPGTKALQLQSFAPNVSVASGFEERVHAMFIADKLGPQVTRVRPGPGRLGTTTYAPSVIVNDDELAGQLLRTFLSM